MTLVIALLGALIVMLGMFGLARPDRFRALFDIMSSQQRFLLGIGTRLAMGGLLWWLADELRYSHVMRILAVIAVLSATGILVMGRARLDKLINWWLARPDGLLRVSALLAAAFGGFLVYVAT